MPVAERTCPETAGESPFGTTRPRTIRIDQDMTQISTKLPDDADAVVLSRGQRKVAAISPALDTSSAVVVCIPSFRRPQHLRRTLQSLARQRTGRRFAVVIVENDAEGRESLAVAADMLERGSLRGPVSYTHLRAHETDSYLVCRLL